jgi:hypothetical protein
LPRHFLSRQEMAGRLAAGKWDLAVPRWLATIKPASVGTGGYRD